MVLRRVLPLFIIAVGLILLCSCATKKHVRQEVATAKAELDKRIDEEASRRTDLANQVGELSTLNKKNAARIEQVQGNVDTAVRTLEPKIEDARKTGVDAGDAAKQAMSAAKDNQAAFENRNNLQVLATQDVQFKFNSVEVDDEAKARLEEVSKLLSNNKNLLLELQGYTDNVGDPAYNVQLSNRRVENVKRHLVGELKLDLHRISSLGLGEANPQDDNKTREGRARNRRVTITVLGLK